MTKAEHADVPTLAAYLRECHVTKGSPSYREMARHVSLSSSAIQTILTGRCVPKPGTLSELAGYLGADMVKANQLAAHSQTAPRTPRAPRVTLRELCCEVSALRHAMVELTNTMRQAR